MFDSLTAADKLHDFVTVAGFNRSLRPYVTRKYFEVTLDSHSARIQAKRNEQIGNHGAGPCFALLAIHNNRNRRFHRHISFESQLELFAYAVGTRGRALS